jgi:imidazolonepropionase-like amidohydrolase
MQSFSIFAGWLIDGTGAPASENMFLRIENGLIAKLRPARQADMYAADLLNLSHCTLLPGLFDCHVHTCMSGTLDPEPRRRQLNCDFDQAAPVIQEHLLAHLNHGIVAVRDGGDYAAHSLRFKRERLRTTGLPLELLSPGKAWRCRGRYGRIIGRPAPDGQSLAEAILEKNVGTDHVKIVNSGVNSLAQFAKETPPQFPYEELAAAVRSGQKMGLKTMAHANGRQPVRWALEAGCHSIEHGFFMGSENLQWMADRQIFWTPTAYTMKAYCQFAENTNGQAEIAQKNLDHQLEQIALARQLEVPLVLGTDSGSLGVDHGEALIEELRLFMEAGYSLEAGIRAATFNAARLLGLEKEMGRISKGMPATFLVTQGVPSQLPDALSHPQAVYIRGQWWAAPKTLESPVGPATL